MQAPVTPDGVTFNGRSEIIPGRGLLHFTDTATGSDLTVPDVQGTPEVIERAVLESRERYTPETTER